MPRTAGGPKTTLTERLVGDTIFNRARKMAEANEEELDTSHLTKAAQAIQNVVKTADAIKPALARAQWKMDHATEAETDEE